MLAISDLVPLLYRARWIQFSLVAEVRSRRQVAGPDEYDELSGTVLAAPGGRYRVDIVNEDGDRQLTIYDGQSGGIAFSDLLSPSWLLAEFDLEVTGETEHIGRAAYVVAGRPRPAGNGRAGRVSALVDAELGVLLRYEKAGPRQQAETAEFISLRVEAAESVDPALFTRPPVVQPAQGKPGPDDRAAAPESAPRGTSPDLLDEQVNLLYRSGLEPQRLSAELQELADRKTLMRLAAAALSSTETGSRTRWLWESVVDDPPQDIDLTARLTVAMPGCYRIEAMTDPGSKPACMASDGEHLWKVYLDRIAVGPAEPPPAGISLIIDPAWLLDGYWLSAEGAATVSGRPALRVVAVPTGNAPLNIRQGPLSGTVAVADKIEATIDVQLGVALRQVWCFDGTPVLSTELSGVTEDADPAAFRIEPPPGIPVVTGGSLAEASLSPGGAAWMITKGASKMAVEISKRWAKKQRL
jgi:hypothetical protein